MSRPLPDAARPQFPARALAALAALALMAAGCTPVVRGAWIRQDYHRVDRLKTLRVAVVTAPLPAGQQDLGKLWSVIATRWMNQHRDFITKDPTEAQAMPAHPCHDDLDGVLHLRPTLVRAGDRVTAKVHATLVRCSDGKPIWAADAKGTWPLADPEIKDLTQTYVAQMGEAVRPYVPASFHLLRATLATLPHPKLVKDADVMEKIQLGD